MVAKNMKKTPQDSASKQPKPATKRAPPKKPPQDSASPQQSVQQSVLHLKGKPSFQLVDEDDEAQQESVPQGEGDDPALELAKKMSLDAHQEKGEGEGVDADIEQEDQAGSDPGKAHEALAGPDPEPLQLITNERVIEDNPESHSGFMSFMKNLEDTDNFGDQFLYDKPTEDEHEKSKVIDESDSTIPDPIPTVVDKYLGTKLDDALLRVLERHTADLIKKYSVLPGPESIKNQESKKSLKEIIRIKREQGEKEQESTYTIRSTDKVALEEFDLKSALFKHMNKNRTANRNPANYHLYHALMEALIADEDAMDKEVKDKVKDHKRKHDSDDDEDDDDDEGPSAGSNQGKSAKRRRPDSGASGSAQPPLKDDDQSSKKPRKSNASASKQHPALTLTRWQITDTRDAIVDSSIHRSDPKSEHYEQSSYDIPMQDEGHVSDLEDTNNVHIPKVLTTTLFKPIPEGERPATPEPEWTIPSNDFLEPEKN
ncbi:hypothetical protein Tco_0174695 [Tanacetum coccineum]